MKVLYVVTKPFSNPKSGEEIRFNQIHQSLLDIGCDVFVYCVGQTPPAYKPNLTNLSRPPIQLLSAENRVQLRQIISATPFDAIILTHPESTDFIHTIRQVCPDVPVVIDTQNFELTLQMKKSHQRSWLQFFTLAFAERMYFRKAASVWTVSDEDRSRYEQKYRLSHVATIPVIPFDPQATGEIVNAHPGNPPSLLFVGSYSYKPNEDAARFLVESVMPEVWKLDGDVSLTLAGRNPTRWMRTLKDSRIHATGEVTSMHTMYQNSTVVVAPLRMGGGVKLKMIEAMAHGSAIVCTPEAVRGIRATAGRDYVESIADGKTFAHTICSAFANRDRLMEIGMNARKIITEEYSLKNLTSSIRFDLMKLVQRNDAVVQDGKSIGGAIR